MQTVQSGDAFKDTVFSWGLKMSNFKLAGSKVPLFAFIAK
jgi:hypothetical protein